jgi:hypothetical protein
MMKKKVRHPYEVKKILKVLSVLRRAILHRVDEKSFAKH